MQIAQIERIAQQIVDATAPLVGGHTINIMDTGGMIIASSAPERIGQFHPGAAQVIQSGEIVCITREKVSFYPGAREGINLPVVWEGMLVGVVGIHGDPAVVEAAANLLRVCVGLYLDQEAQTERRQRSQIIRHRLLQMLTAEEEPVPARVAALAAELGETVSLPVRMVAICLPDQKRAGKPRRLLERAQTALLEEGYLRSAGNFCGLLGDWLAVLIPAHWSAAEMARMVERLRSILGDEMALAAGLPANTWGDVKYTWREAQAVCRFAPRAYVDLAESGAHRLRYLLESVPAHVKKRMIEPLYQMLLREFGEKNIGWAIETARAYCETDGSITLAAERLHLHKNTLLYRIKKMQTVLGLEQQNGFSKLYFLSQIVFYYDEKRRMTP